MWFIGGAPPRLLFFSGQLTSLLIVIYDYPAAHEPGAVSYTHLDVYKRQHHQQPDHEQGGDAGKELPADEYYQGSTGALGVRL